MLLEIGNFRQGQEEVSGIKINDALEEISLIVFCHECWPTFIAISNNEKFPIHFFPILYIWKQKIEKINGKVQWKNKYTVQPRSIQFIMGGLLLYVNN